MEEFKDRNGCCVYWFMNGDERMGSGDIELLRGVFSACDDVEVPGKCTSSSPPQEFLECAGIEPTGAAAIIAPFYVAAFYVAAFIIAIISILI